MGHVSMSARRPRLAVKTVVVSLFINFLVSLIVLPLLIPPFRSYTIGELAEVLFWQVVGLIGWPLGILGCLSTMIAEGGANNVDGLLLFLYPLMLFLLVYTLVSQQHRRWTLVSLHLAVTVSFATVWYKVLNGYDFMGG